MARALIVGCGCRGRALGTALRDEGWAVRGTSRNDAGLDAITAAGLEGSRADPDRLATITEGLGDVTVLVWLMGSVGREAAERLNVERLESLLERLVDTPVRGFVYEAAGSAPAETRERGAELTAAAARRWHVPVRILRSDPAMTDTWLAGARDAVKAVLERG